VGLEHALAEPGTFDHINSKPASADEVGAFVRRLSQDPTILTLRRGPDVVGFCSLEVIGGGWAEIGVVLAPSTHRQGLATEALEALIDLAMKQPRLGGVVAGVKPANIAARRLVERFGFVLIGTVPGARNDELAYRLSRADRAAELTTARTTTKNALTSLIITCGTMAWNLGAEIFCSCVKKSAFNGGRQSGGAARLKAAPRDAPAPGTTTFRAITRGR
jgi:RimJ/RimL family protein N-acetyltransferase